jgi:drug/metabolite transporter (DMT)-like permease
MNKKRIIAFIVAITVTIIWSFSFIVISVGLEDIPPVTFAALRYLLAFFFQVPIFLFTKNRISLKTLTKTDWRTFILYGIIFYTINQMVPFVALTYISPIIFSMVMNFTVLAVALLGVLFLHEKLAWMQIVGIIVFIAGVFFYFFPLGQIDLNWIGVGIAFIGVASNAVATVMGRAVNRQGKYSPFIITFISMGIGSILMFIVALIVDGFPQLPLWAWGLIVLLALVNTALAFNMWNFSQRTLTATEITMINNLMLVEIAILSWLFLDTTLTLKQIISIIVVLVGIAVVQLYPQFKRTEQKLEEVELEVLEGK